MILPQCLNCPIEAGEKAKGSEICCISARQCCYTCFDDSCPIKEEYAKEIQEWNDKVNEEVEKIMRDSHGK